MTNLGSVFVLLLPFFFYPINGLEGNARRDPQKISDDAESLCAGRSDRCEVQLDVPFDCVDASTSTSTCPIVFFLHGGGGNIQGYINKSGVHENSMIGIYPQGDNGWNTGPKNTNLCDWDDYSCTSDPNEGEFVTKIIEHVRDLGAIGNVYAIGGSNGGALAHILAVNSGTDLPIIGIVALVAILLESPTRHGPGHLNYHQPIASNPLVSVLTICGTEDYLVPYDGGFSPVHGGNENFYFMSADDGNIAWATHNGCNLQPIVKNVSSSIGNDAQYFQYPNCSNGTYVEHYQVRGAGHNAGGAQLDGKRSKEVAFDFIRKCEVSEVSKVQAPVSSTIGTTLPECKNDNDWHGKYSVTHTCDVVAISPNDRCLWTNSMGTIAMDACCLVCTILGDN